MRNLTRFCFILIITTFFAPALHAQYMVSGADNTNVNGIYYETDTKNGNPLYSNGNYYLGYLNCNPVKWEISSSIGNCPEFSTYNDGDVPPNFGWHEGGGYSGTMEDTIIVAKLNSIAYDNEIFMESISDDGTFNASINILLFTKDNPFAGTNEEDFVATGKVIVSNLPEGLAASIVRKSDNTLKASLTGTATNHTPEYNISNLSFVFQNSAFIDKNASEIEFSTKNDLKIMFMEKYLVYGATETPEVNDTFLLSGVYNGRSFYTSDFYTIYYKGCTYENQGVAWVLGEFDGCPEYSTAIRGQNLHSWEWSYGGEGGDHTDTIFIHKLNSLGLSINKFYESSNDDGSIKDTMTIIFVAPKDGNAFTGLNGDDFVTEGKVIASNVPEGLTLVAERSSDTSLKLRFTGTATVHNYISSIKNLELAFQNTAFTGNNASLVENSNIQDIEIKFIQKYEVIGATSTPEVNGTYVSAGEFNDKPFYSKGEYRLGYRGCTSKWVIVGGDDDININKNDGNCPEYYNYQAGNYPPMYGWYPSDPLYVIPHNTIFYNTENIAEAITDDGTIEDTLALTYYYPEGSNVFSGINGDDFIANGKIIVSNLPDGLTAVAERTSDTTITIRFNGAAINHSFSVNITNLTFEFQNSAFTNENAASVGNYLKNDLNIVFVAKYEVFNAIDDPEINGTYVSAGYFNDKPYFTFGEYRLGYRGCTGNTQWVIVDGDNYINLAAGYCPMIYTYVNGDLPPNEDWDDDDVQVYPHNSLYYYKTIFKESLTGDGSIDNSDTLIIRYFFPTGSASFSGNNGDDFVADNKIEISNLPSGLTAVVERISDTTLAVILNGKADASDVNNLTFIFTDGAFNGMNASNVIYSTKNDLKVDFHNEYYVASIGGDFSTIAGAVNSQYVDDGDVLILAAETFTEYGITINKSLTLKGQGAGKTIVQANELPATASNRIFTINFNSENNGNVTIENMTLQHGNISESGGAIYSNNCDLTIKNCEIANNRTNIQGGAIISYNSNFTATNSTFLNNSILSTYSSNYNGGGAIYLNGNTNFNTALITNCTFSGNSVGSLGQQNGGAIHCNHNVKITNSTFANNTAYSGGAIYRYGGYLELINTLIADNTASVSYNDIYGAITANYCLIENATGATIIGGANNITGSDPELSAIADNGGSTQTCAISATSVAKDAGTNTSVPELDQRGVGIFNSIKDIGAYEYNTEPVIIVSDTLLESGNIALGDSAEYNYTVSAINLTNNLVITAPPGFEISGYSGSEFINASPMTIVPSAGFISETVIYVKYKPETIGSVEEIITNKSTDAETINVTYTANVVSSPTGDDGSVLILENLNNYFESGDFIFNDADGGVFGGIKIISKETNGDLEYDCSNVVNGDICDDITKLSFAAYPDESGLSYATFTFKVKDNTGLYSESAYTMTIDVNDIPVGANDAVSTDEDMDFVFAAEDFTFTNTLGDFNGIQIISVQTAGDLKYNNVSVTADMECPDVTLLVFSAEENANGDAYATFEFKVKDDLGAYSEETYTMTINVTAVNDAPEGANNSVTTEEDVDLAFANTDFTYSDLEGDAFAGVSIVSVETTGDLEYDGSDVAANTDCIDLTKLVFKPAANENGDSYATFEFKVKDNLGAYSAEIYTMTINVNAVNDAPIVANVIPDGNAEEGIAYTYTVPENTFADVDAGDILTYTASLSDGNLPNWLSFDDATRVFSGIPDADGSIIIRVTATDESSASVYDDFILTIAPATTGIEDVFGKEFKVYPNPTSGVINVLVENLNSEMNIQILDLTGKVLFIQTIQNINTKIDLSDYAKGLYFIQLNNNNVINTQRIIIE